MKRLISLALLISVAVSGSAKKIVEHYDDGVVSYRAQLHKNELNGKTESFFKNGQLWKVENYKKGKRDGLIEYYYEDFDPQSNGKYRPVGQLEARYYYRNGHQNGYERRYYRDGQFESERYYVDGVESGTRTEYHPNGKLKFSGDLVDGKASGVWNYYYDNGQLWEVANYKDDKYDGERIKYNRKGELMASMLYKDGELVEHSEKADTAVVDQRDPEDLRLEKYYKELEEAYNLGDNERYDSLREAHEEDDLDLIVSIYTEDQRDGEFKEYYSTGEVKMVTTRAKGLDHGPTTVYYKDGTIARLIEYKYGEPDGRVASYYKNGQLKFEGVLKAGTPDGRWNFYSSAGVLTRTTLVKDGNTVEDIKFDEEK